MTNEERFWYERGLYEGDLTTRIAIAEDLRAVAALYADTTVTPMTEYRRAVQASYLSAAERVLPLKEPAHADPSPSPSPSPSPISSPDTSGDLDCDDEHD